MMEIIYYFIVRRIQKGRWYISIVVLAVVVCISYLAKNYLSWQLPWGINTALTAGVFFYLGYLYKRYGLLEKGSYIMRLYVIIPAFVGGFAACFANQKVSWRNYQYGILTLALVSGICLSLVVIFFSVKIERNKILEYIGKNTLGILIFHKLAIVVFQTKLGKISDLLADSNIVTELPLSILTVIISTVCSLVATEIVRRILPVLIGEKRNKLQ